MQIKFSLAKTGPYLGWRLASIVLVGGMCLSVLLTSFFIYQNIYRALDDANTIIVLNALEGYDTIDLTTFSKAKVQIGIKQDLISIPTSLRNIFIYPPTSTLHVETPTTTPNPTSASSSRFNTSSTPNR